MTTTNQIQATLDGWYFTGPGGRDGTIPAMEAGIKPELRRNERPVAYVRSTIEQPEPLTLLYQAVSAERYRDKRIRFSAEILRVGEQGRGRLWLRVVPRGRAFNYAFGYADATPDWHRGEIVADVDPQADGIVFGVGVWERGEVWVCDARFEVVDKSVPTSHEPFPDHERPEPVNLTFEG